MSAVATLAPAIMPCTGFLISASVCLLPGTAVLRGVQMHFPPDALLSPPPTPHYLQCSNHPHRRPHPPLATYLPPRRSTMSRPMIQSSSCSDRNGSSSHNC